MIARRIAAVVAILIAAAPIPARSQSTDARQLIAEARTGTARYADVNAAISDGFKRVGVEFPAMGEHWVSLSRILENRFNPTRPSVLIYVTMRGKRQLAGVGYTALLGDGEQPPPTAAKFSDWHEHNGSVIDESLPVHSGAAHSAMLPEAAELGATRLAILHVWAWTTNPAGAFVTENWSLPLHRAGIAPRAMATQAVRGLSLADDSASYYEQTLSTTLRMTDVETKVIHTIVADSRRKARSAVAGPLSARDDALEASWTGMWLMLERALPVRTADLRALRAKL
jgi:hypothetical protein